MERFLVLQSDSGEETSALPRYLNPPAPNTGPCCPYAWPAVLLAADGLQPDVPLTCSSRQGKALLEKLVAATSFNCISFTSKDERCAHIIGASLSEPHTSDTTGLYVYLRTSLPPEAPDACAHARYVVLILAHCACK